MRNAELDYFLAANNFFRADLREKREIVSRYVDAYGWPPFVYGAEMDNEVDEKEHLLCNFSFWVFCVFVQYSLLDCFDDDRVLMSRISVAKRLMNRLLMKYSYECDDQHLIAYFERSSFLSGVAARISEKIGVGADLPNMDYVVDIWEFVPHPDRVRLMKELGL